jgi:hypothetical protein
LPLLCAHPLILQKSIPPSDVDIPFDVEEITCHPRIWTKEFVPVIDRNSVTKASQGYLAAPLRYNTISLDKIDPIILCCVDGFKVVLVDYLVEIGSLPYDAYIFPALCKIRARQVKVSAVPDNTLFNWPTMELPGGRSANIGY